VRTVSLTSNSTRLNDQYNPLSSTSAKNYTPTIEYHKPKQDASHTRFFETFHNKYYDQLEALQKMKVSSKEEVERERSNQVKKSGNEV